MAILNIGFVDLMTGLSTAPVLTSFPLTVELASGTTPVWWDDHNSAAAKFAYAAFVATNGYEVVAPAGADLHVGAAVRQVDDNGQKIEISILANGLLDASVTVRINTSILTDNVDYTTAPTPARGESFVIAGTRSTGGGPVPGITFVRHPTTASVLDDLTVRWLGATGFAKPPSADAPRYTATFTGSRTNKAIRASALMTDTRLQPNTWEMVSARVVDLPETMAVLADTYSPFIRWSDPERFFPALAEAWSQHATSAPWASGPPGAAGP